MTTQEIRRAYLDYFIRNGHTEVESASLVPFDDDPSVLLTIAGMQPLKAYFMGTEDPPSHRLTSCQKCFRTGDIDQIGYTARHLTFFEMLGNFSLGDYFKKEAIRFGWEVSTEVFGMDPERIWITVFEGMDGVLARDSFEINIPGLQHRIGVAEFVEHGVADQDFRTVGLSGDDGGLITARKAAHPDADLGFVGKTCDEALQIAERGLLNDPWLPRPAGPNPHQVAGLDQALAQQLPFARPTRAGGSHEPFRRHQARQLGDLRLASDERRQRHRQRVRHRVERDEVVELVGGSGNHQLPDVLGPSQVPEAVLAEGAGAGRGDQRQPHVRGREPDLPRAVAVDGAVRRAPEQQRIGAPGRVGVAGGDREVMQGVNHEGLDTERARCPLSPPAGRGLG